MPLSSLHSKLDPDRLETNLNLAVVEWVFAFGSESITVRRAKQTELLPHRSVAPRRVTDDKAASVERDLEVRQIAAVAERTLRSLINRDATLIPAPVRVAKRRQSYRIRSHD